MEIKQTNFRGFSFLLYRLSSCSGSSALRSIQKTAEQTKVERDIFPMKLTKVENCVGCTVNSFFGEGLF